MPVVRALAQSGIFVAVFDFLVGDRLPRGGQCVGDEGCQVGGHIGPAYFAAFFEARFVIERILDAIFVVLEVFFDSRVVRLLGCGHVVGHRERNHRHLDLSIDAIEISAFLSGSWARVGPANRQVLVLLGQQFFFQLLVELRP